MTFHMKKILVIIFVSWLYSLVSHFAEIVPIFKSFNLEIELVEEFIDLWSINATHIVLDIFTYHIGTSPTPPFYIFFVVSMSLIGFLIRMCYALISFVIEYLSTVSKSYESYLKIKSFGAKL